MPANYSGLFDSVLVIAGLVLVVIGLVMFVRSKSSGDASSVEAFGIKLNVTHPSLILVLAGVGLMLAPRLLPGLPGPPDASPSTRPAVATGAPPPLAGPPAETTSTSPPPARPPSPLSASRKPTSSTAPASTAPASTTHPVTSRPARSIAPSGSARAPSPAPARSSAATPVKSVPPPAMARAPEPDPSPRAAAPTPASAAAKPARPAVAYAALGLPINRDFWSGETQTSYTRRMHTSLRQAGQTVLRLPMRNLDLDQAEFNRWWNESRDQPVSRAYCAAASAPLALISARIETSFTLSSVESAYWPEFSLRLYHCATHRVYRQRKSLSPENADAWPFSTELNSEIERFLRTYRGDLADQDGRSE